MKSFHQEVFLAAYLVTAIVIKDVVVAPFLQHRAASNKQGNKKLHHYTQN